MLQLDNDTPFAADIATMPNRHGVDSLQILVQGTYLLGSGAVADRQHPIARADVFCGTPGASSLLEASPFHLPKSGTDVVLVGHAHAPGERPVTRMPVSIRVAERREVIAVFGDRVWRSMGRSTTPAPFVRMPLVYERAFGGANATTRDEQQAAMRNPVGVGLDAGTGQPLPNLERPDALIEAPRDRPRPACLAPIAAAWHPRCHFAGTYDERWRRRRAPMLPDDFDPRFLRVAAEPLAFDRFLEGSEPIELVGVSPRGTLRGAVPSGRPAVTVCERGRWTDPVAARLETVDLRPDEGELRATWRVSLNVDRRLLRLERIRISAEGLGREGIAA